MLKKSLLTLCAALIAAPAAAWAANPVLSGTYTMQETEQCFGSSFLGANSYTGSLTFNKAGQVSASMAVDYAFQGSSASNGTIGVANTTYATSPTTLTLSGIPPYATATAFFGYPNAAGISTTVSFSYAYNNGSSPCLYSGTLTQ
jgi:hypothetical protein